MLLKKIHLLKNVPVALQYMRYRLVSSNAHDLHSPFVFDLYNNVIRDRTPFYAYQAIESIRSKMLLSDEKIVVHDLGTGGEKYSQKKLALSFIAKQYVKPAKYGQLLFRLVNQFHPVHLLELGTSLGITTLYLASPHSDAKVITIEGCPDTAAVAKKNFSIAKAGNVEQVVGEFNEVLPGILKKTSQLDFVYFDGNHRKDATLDYFNQCLAKHHEFSVFVFDDIHWSSGMEEAWKIIQQNETVTCSIDLFFCGIVFFRKGFPKQHFILKY
jgi:predicted O-methyltransferase YrrM